MSIIEKINSSNSEQEILSLIEEHVIDIETPMGWGEEADVLEQNGEIEKAEILRAAKKRFHELDNE